MYKKYIWRCTSNPINVIDFIATLMNNLLIIKPPHFFYFVMK